MAKKERFNGDSCKNARIKINYSKDKPKVSFSYPDKKNQRSEGTMFLTILVFWLFLNTPALFFISIAGSNHYWDSPEAPFDRYNLTDCMTYYETNINYTLLWDNVCEDKSKSIKVQIWDSLTDDFRKDLNDIFNDISTFRIILWLFGMPLLIYFPFKKDWNNYVMPMWNGMGSKKYVCFKAKDVLKDVKGIYCEIPLFANVVLNYEAQEDFSKYLDEFEIREHNFKYFKSYRKKKKKQVNEFIWYARFYFKKAPKKGKLEVIFR